MKDKVLIRFAARFRQGIMEGRPSRAMCFAVSAPLQGLLAVYGVETELVSGMVSELEEGDTTEWNHCWLKLPAGRVLDPTADQFLPELPEVYLGQALGIHQEATPSR